MWVTQWADEASWFEVLGVAVVLNAATTLSSVALWKVFVRRRHVTPLVRPPGRRDYRLAALTTSVNALTLLAAWWVVRRDLITIAEPSPATFVIDVAYLLFGLDAAMYALHRLFHTEPLYRWSHELHHTGDERMCCLTLFVMHPAEAAGFGFVTAVLMTAHSVSIAAIGAFFSLNLLVGTLSHVPVGQSSESPNSRFAAVGRWLGGSQSHGSHHAMPGTNFGFFTQIWDRILRTN